jgi:hypothetical protein
MIELGLSIGWKDNSKNNQSYVNSLIIQFKDRVIADGGFFEAQACLKATLTVLNNIN